MLISLSPTRLKKQLKGGHFSSDAEVIAAAETWLDGQPSELFLSGLQKLEFGRCTFFLPGRAKDLSAPRYCIMSDYQALSSLQFDSEFCHNSNIETD